MVDDTEEVGGDGASVQDQEEIEGDSTGPGGGSEGGPLLRDVGTSETDPELGELVISSHSSTWIPLDLLT